jgi:RNA recognition motif-containing protein
MKGPNVSKRIFVGNLPFSAVEADVRELFTPHGEVHSVTLIEDRDTGRSRGFAFVEMDDEIADAAIAALENTVLQDRTLNINEAKPRLAGGGGGRDTRGRANDYRW